MRFVSSVWMVALVACDGGQDLGSNLDANRDGRTGGPGELIAYVEQLGTSNEKALFVANRDGTNPRMIHFGPTIQSPSWSPDGQWIAFVSDEKLHIIGVDGQGLTPVNVTGSSVVYVPEWSPDGAQILFTGSPSNIYVVPVTGGAATMIAGPDASNAAWSPDGTKIVYRQGIEDLYVANADGSAPQKIVGPLVDFFTPGTAWSADGSLIAYSVGDFEADVFTVPAAGGTPQRRTSAPGGEYNLTFSPDGEKLAMYHFQDQQNYGIYELTLATGALVSLIPEATDPAYQP